MTYGTLVGCVELCWSDMGRHLLVVIGLTTCIKLLIGKRLHVMNTRKRKINQYQLRMDQLVKRI